MGTLKLIVGTVVALCASQAYAATIGNWDGSARSWNGSDFTTINSLMTGTGNTVEANSALTAANLAGDQVYIIGEGTRTLTATETADLLAWVQGGGRLLVFTDSSFTGGASANSILSSLGSTLFVNSAFTNAVGPAQAGNFATEGGPYNIVGQYLTVSPGNLVTVGGGTMLYPDELGVQQIGQGFVYAFGDRWDHNFAAPSAANTNGELFLNIVNGSPPSAVVPLPAAIWSGAALLGALGLGRARRRKA